jgi:N-acetylmuramoyl-L-alanine amidase
MLTSKINESSTLAEAIQTSLIQRLKGHYDGVVDLGVKRGPFYVLFGAQMPSILVEALFLTNDQDRKRLLSTNYREGVAQALMAGIENYSQGGRP